MKKTIKREDFVRYLASHANLTYVEAEQAYTAFMRMFEHAMASRSSINFGRVGVMEPQDLKPRRVTMGFRRLGGKVTKCRREFWLGLRTRYIFRTHRAFAEDHDLVQ